MKCCEYSTSGLLKDLTSAVGRYLKIILRTSYDHLNIGSEIDNDKRLSFKAVTHKLDNFYLKTIVRSFVKAYPGI
jgi:hypothetical protein